MVSPKVTEAVPLLAIASLGIASKGGRSTQCAFYFVRIDTRLLGNHFVTPGQQVTKINVIIANLAI